MHRFITKVCWDSIGKSSISALPVETSNLVGKNGPMNRASFHWYYYLEWISFNLGSNRTYNGES
jgi:hypothetical protein